VYLNSRKCSAHPAEFALSDFVSRPCICVLLLTGADGCSDLDGWLSSDSYSCADYASSMYCEDGNYGSGWGLSYGTFADYSDADGVDASQACCACGGGTYGRARV
jgi:hypothetical protein